MKKTIVFLLLFEFWLTPVFAQGPVESSANRKKVEYKIKNKCEPLLYDSQEIDGLLGKRLKVNTEALLQIPYYGYLRAYVPGVESFWPAGEYLGKFSQGLMDSYKYSGDQRCMEQVQKIVDTWIEAQQPDGYVATSPEGYLYSERWNTMWTVWDHKYTLLALLDYYAMSKGFADQGEKRVLEAAKKIGNVVSAEFGPEKDRRGPHDAPGRRDLMQTAYYGLVGGSILEPMTYLYQYTGDKKYLNFCNYIINAFEGKSGPQIITELTERSGHVSKVPSAKGYEMLSCIIGIFRMYELTGNPKFLETAERAWQDILADQLYITGTATQGELFWKDNYLPADETTKIVGHPFFKTITMGEGCVTAHWVFLNRILFQLTGDPKYITEIEKSLYNHLLGSQSPKTGEQSYYTALIGHKHFATFNTYGGAPPCCLSSVTRCVSRIPEMIWEKFSDNGFAVLLYNSGGFSAKISTKDGKQVGVDFRIDADNIMESGTAKIDMDLKDPATFRLALRVPSWCRNFKAQLGNGETLTGKPGEFLNIDRKWSGNVDITVSMNVVDQMIEGSPTYKGYYAFKHGPYVLALDRELNPGIDIDQVEINSDTGINLKQAKQLLPKGWIGDQAYSIESKDSKELVLIPFMDAGQNGSKYRVWIPTSEVK